jgi:hypothetical protein
MTKSSKSKLVRLGDAKRWTLGPAGPFVENILTRKLTPD